MVSVANSLDSSAGRPRLRFFNHAELRLGGKRGSHLLQIFKMFAVVARPEGEKRMVTIAAPLAVPACLHELALAAAALMAASAA